MLIKALRAAHAMVTIDGSGQPLLEAAPAASYQRRLVRLAFLAPELQRMILDGHQPVGLTLEQLMHSDVPLSWKAQRAIFAAS